MQGHVFVHQKQKPKKMRPLRLNTQMLIITAVRKGGGGTDIVINYFERQGCSVFLEVNLTIDFNNLKQFPLCPCDQ